MKQFLTFTFAAVFIYLCTAQSFADSSKTFPPAGLGGMDSASPFASDANPKKAILVTNNSPTFSPAAELDAFTAELQKTHPTIPVKMAFSAPGAHKTGLNSDNDHPSVIHAISTLSDAGCTKITLVTLSVVHDETYRMLLETAAAVKRIPAAYVNVQITPPLLNSDEDVSGLAANLIHSMPNNLQKGEAVLFAGSTESGSGSIAYPALNWSLMLQGERGSLYLAVNLENSSSLDSALNILKINKIKTAWIIPLSAVNTDEVKADLFDLERNSLAAKLRAAGIGTKHHEYGLISNPAILTIWKKKLQESLNKMP